MKIHTLTLVAIAASPLLIEASQTRQPDNLIELQKPPALRQMKTKPVKKAKAMAIKKATATQPEQRLRKSD